MKLVFSDPILAKNLISWELAVTRIAEGSKEAAEAVTSRHLPGAELHSDMNIRVPGNLVNSKLGNARQPSAWRCSVRRRHAS